jgi:FkbM family methyltransferase
MEMEYLVPQLVTLRELGFYPKTVLDIGCNRGHFIEIVRHVWGDGPQITAVEANRDCAPLMEKVKNVDVHFEVVGYQTGPIPFYRTRHDKTSGGSSIYREISPYFRGEWEHIEERTPVPLSRFYPPNGPPDLLKVDTQGSEGDILECIRLETLEHPIVIIAEGSFLRCNDGAPLCAHMIGDLRDIGYELWDVTGPDRGGHWLRRRKSQADFFFVRGDQEWAFRAPELE